MGKRIDTLMNYFQEIFKTLEEKKKKAMEDNPEKAKSLLGKGAFAKVLPPGKYMLQERTGYGVIILESDFKKQQKKIEDLPSTSKQVERQKEVEEITDVP